MPMAQLQQTVEWLEKACGGIKTLGLFGKHSPIQQ